ncbi:MAG: PAS domain S-box protein [Actinobacteria bacterium]|nr:PAS domain S-box protein [Actinomycetota bacterium]MCG2818365.1 PAS domain S-box protein [Actinomycetes bacterium]MBU4219903.1 PAS domain S-box protein [Actinomycetota bacterium]MBU4360064.1 PAS domain S-box protein [Actinomycetota bacterium]MBU4391451.1 PAS domain S-box protein [Actinomycetota bacterium]
MFRSKKRKETVSPPDREIYRDFADALDSAVLVITEDHEIRYMSKSAKRAWGSKEGKKCHLVLRNSRTVCPECPLKEVVASSGADKCEMRMRSLDGWHDHENLFIHVGDPSYPEQYVALLSTNIDERKSLEREAMESERRFRDLFDSSIDGIIYTDMEGRILNANKAYLDMLGYSISEMRSLTKQQLTPAEWHEMEERITRSQVAVSGHSDEYEKENIRKDGSVFPVSVRVWLTEGEDEEPVGMWGIVRDITQRKATEEALRESEERYRLIAESLLVGIMVHDGKDILYLNDRMVEISGYQRDHFEVMQNALDILVDGERERVTANMTRRIAGEDVPEVYDTRILRADGEIAEVQLMNEVITLGGKPAVMVMINDMTQRVKAEEAVKESEERYRTIVENSNDSIVMTNRSGELLYSNDATERVFGFASDDIMGTNLFQFVHPDDREKVALAFMQDWKTGQTIPDYPVKLVKADGSTVFAETTSGIIGWPGEDAKQIFVIRDVTERHHREEERALKLKMEEGSAAITSRLIDPVDVNAAIGETLEGAGELLGADRTCYLEMSTDRDTESSTMEWALEGVEPLGNELRKQVDVSGSWWVETFKNHEVIAFDDSGQVPDDASRDFLEKKGIHFMAAAPVFIKGRLMGFLGIGDGEIGRQWSEHEIGFIRGMAETVSRTLERREWVEELERSERFRTRITENIDEGLIVLRNGIVTWVNRRLCEIHGYEPEELIGKTTPFLVPGSGYAGEYVGRMLASLNETGRYVSEEKAVRKDGAVIDVLLAVTPLVGTEEEEGTFELLATVRDITEARRMQAEVKAAADAYSTLFSTAGDGLVVHSVEGKIMDANERASIYTGYDRDELLGMNTIRLVPGEDRQHLQDRRKELEVEGSTVFEVDLARKRGGTTPVEVTARMTRIWGESVVLSSLRDITERKKAEGEIRRRAAQLSSLNKIGKAATSSLNLDIALEEILDVALDISGVGSGVITVQAPSSGERTAVVAGRGLSFEYIKRVNDEGVRRRGIDYATSSGSAILNLDGDCPPEVNPWACEDLLKEGVAQAVFIPLLSGEKTMGGMILASESPGRFEERDIDFYNAIGAEIGVSVENGLVYRELAAEHERLSLLYRIAQSISGELEMEALLDTTVEEAAGVVGADNALIAEVEPGVREFRWSASYNLDIKKMDGIVMPVEDGVWGKAIKSKRAVRFPMAGKVVEDFREDKVASALGTKSGVVVPLISGDRVMGVIGIHFTSEGMPLSDEDVLLLEAMGRQAGVAIDKAQLFEETKQHLEALEKAHRELMVLDRMKSDFVSTVSHELRSPLAVIEGFAKTLVENFDRIDRETERESIEIILKKAIALEGLIENILDMSRIEEGRLAVSLEPLDVVELCELVRADQERVAERHEVTLEAPTGEITVVADREKVEVALGNLVRNAVKFSPDGGKVAILVREAGVMAEIEVTDQGISIPIGEQERVFDRFYQVDSGETRSFQGSGLGLYITRELVEAMGGTVTMESEPGLGSTFRFTLPLAR